MLSRPFHGCESAAARYRVGRAFRQRFQTRTNARRPRRTIARTMDGTPLVEREGELEAIDGLLARARGGAGGTLLIEGPAGIGKSSLLAATREVAGEARVAAARGSELEREFPLGVVRKLLEPVLAGATDEERGALL